MKLRHLGSTGCKVSVIGLGGTAFFHSGKTEDPETLIGAALDGGINIIDTAREYHNSEIIIGSALSSMKARDNFIIASKTSRRDFSGAMADIEKSLKNLRTDRIDLYQAHNIQYREELEAVSGIKGAMGALLKAKEQGKILHIGFSAHRPGMMQETIGTGLFETIQLPVNYIEYESMKPVIREAAAKSMGIFAMKAFCGGAISNKALALKFTLKMGLSSVFVGAVNIKELTDDIRAAAENDGSSPEETAGMLETEDAAAGQFCRLCRTCESSCPKGIPVADIFRSERHIIYSATFARNEYRAMPANFLKCDLCGSCDKACPYSLPVTEMLGKAHARLSGGRVEDFVANIARKAGIYDRLRNLYFKLKLPLPKR